MTGGADGRVTAWDAATFQAVHSARGGERVSCVALSRCASLHALCAVGSEAREVRLFDLATGSAAQTLTGGAGAAGHAAGPVLALEWSPRAEFQLVSAARDGRVLQWDVRRSGAAALLGALDQHARDARRRRSEAPTATALAASVAHVGGANGLAFAPAPSGAHCADDELFTAGLDQSVRSWGVAAVPDAGVPLLAEDESELATRVRTLRVASWPTLRSFGDAGTVRNRAARRVALCCAPSGAGAAAILFHPNSGGASGGSGGAAHALGGDGGGSVLAFDTLSGNVVGEMKGHHGAVLGLALNVRTQELFSSGDDGLILKWGVAGVTGSRAEES